MVKRFYHINNLVFAEHPKAHNFKNLTGKVFGRLKILGFAGRVEHTTRKKPAWFCLCSCGKTVRVLAQTLNNGNTKSCGCWNRQSAIESNKKRSGRDIHSINLKKTPEYKAYNNIKQRCTNPNLSRYEDYGGRGIQLNLTFEEFMLEVGKRPSKNHSIDRINNDLGYEKGNIRWATGIEQANNKRNNTIITINGESRTKANWELLIGKRAVDRIYRRGWCVKCAKNLPLQSRKPKNCLSCKPSIPKNS